MSPSPNTGPHPATTGRNAVARVAETHFFLRPVLKKALKDQVITNPAMAIPGKIISTYGDYWVESFGDRFFDMGTFVRLGTAVEVGLRDYHFAVSGQHPKDVLVFQRLVKPQGVIDLFKNDCSYDLTTNSAFNAMRELMVHRHLFAHRSGLVDQRYIDDYKLVTGTDVTAQMTANGFPNDDVYWFEPLKRLSPDANDAGLIEAAKVFFHQLP